MTEDAINNSYQILEEFKCKQQKQSIRKPLSKKPITHHGRSGKCRTYTDEQKLLYKLQNYKPRMFNF
uniref:Uncharacterized protein n=1 Tax=viral metagenome TaxID=1070528 RepID=A0A6H2A6M4_9ZZZZ